MIEEFSGGYYRANMNVQRYEDGPAIERGLYDFINREFYYQTDAPVTMRVGLAGGPYFRPLAEGAMPTDVLGLPAALCDELGVHPSADDVSVFIMKPEHAFMFGNSHKTSDISLGEVEFDG